MAAPLRWLVMAVPSLAAIIGMYEVIWRVPWLRSLFGMKVQA